MDGAVWDLNRPLEASCKLTLHDFTTPHGTVHVQLDGVVDLDYSIIVCKIHPPCSGQYTFWHSSAHVLGEALEAQFAAHLCIGPPIDDGGFYYDCQLEGGRYVGIVYIEKPTMSKLRESDCYTFDQKPEF